MPCQQQVCVSYPLKTVSQHLAKLNTPDEALTGQHLDTGVGLPR
ncbi:MAG: hypothetical protein Q8O55_06875 [Dehalococcoidales bacterium]|nr:hypothetical protein [Dehalococcoidales bacterium]